MDPLAINASHSSLANLVFLVIEKNSLVAANGDVKYTFGMKNCDFTPISPKQYKTGSRKADASCQACEVVNRRIFWKEVEAVPPGKYRHEDHPRPGARAARVLSSLRCASQSRCMDIGHLTCTACHRHSNTKFNYFTFVRVKMFFDTTFHFDVI